MFERFTDRARRVIVLCQEACRQSGSHAITEGHLLYGLLEEGGGVGYKVLSSFGLVGAEVCEELCGTRSDGTMMAGHIPFSAHTKKTLENSLREALQLGHNYIGTEHLLLAVVRQPSDHTVAFFTAHHMVADEVRRRVIQRLAGHDGGKGHVHQLLTENLADLDKRIAAAKAELACLQASRQEVWDHLNPDAEQAAS